MAMMVPLPLWFICTVLLLALVGVPVLVLTGAWIAHTARTGKSPLQFISPRAKVAGDTQTPKPRIERPDVRG